MSIRTQNLTKSFGTHAALSDVTLDIPSRAFCCVVGPSGCGKSTLLRLIAGLEAPDAGSVELDGKTVSDGSTFISPEDRFVGVVFQSYALWPHLTVKANVAFPYEAKGFSRNDAMARAATHLSKVALSDYGDRRPEALSGGQRQRVALARCLAGEARTILMDEPLANLDPHLRSAMEAELRAFHDKNEVTTLYITHDQREAMALADVMAVMHSGKVLQFGPPQTIYDRPTNETVARFIGRGTLVHAEVKNGLAAFGDRSVPVDGHGEGMRAIFIRPDKISVAPEGWPVTVTSVHYRGGYWEAVARTQDGGTDVMLDLPHPARVGDQLDLQVSGGWVLPS